MQIRDFKLERYFARYEFSAPYLLCSSDCESFSVDEITRMEKEGDKQLKKVWLGYTESAGSPTLRKEISKLYRDIKQEDLIVFAGAEEAIFIFMNVVLKKGDNIIVQYPAYQSLYEIANSIGCSVTKWTMYDKDNWEPDLDLLKRNIKRNTKAIIINSPHNPTGYLMGKEKLNQVIRIAKEHDLYIFSDEVYRFLEYNSKDRLPAVADVYPKAVSLGVMSKSFGMAGLRIGWLAVKDKKLQQRIQSFKDFTSICNSAPSEFLSMISLKHKEKILQRELEIIKSNLRLLDEFFAKYSEYFEWVRPYAGSIGFPKIKFRQNAEEFCEDLVKKKGVMLLPGTMYEYDNKHFRLGFGRKNMPQALKLLEEYVKENLIR
jgi:aspartate/methionine/tyrosine aminotransferase